MNNQSDFSKGKILPMILRFSIPAAASLLITAIYNIVDRIFIGNFNGNTALAALSICFPLSFMMIAFGLMCSAGGTLFTLYRGKEDTNNANESFSSAFLLTIFFEVLLTICLLLFPSNFLKLFGVTETTYGIGVPALRFNFIIAPVLGFVMLATTFFQSIGKPKASSIITLIRQVLALVPFIYILPFFFGTLGIFCAQPISDLLATILSVILIQKEFQSLPKLEQEKLELSV